MYGKNLEWRAVTGNILGEHDSKFMEMLSKLSPAVVVYAVPNPEVVPENDGTNFDAYKKPECVMISVVGHMLEPTATAVFPRITTVHSEFPLGRAAVGVRPLLEGTGTCHQSLHQIFCADAYETMVVRGLTSFFDPELHQGKIFATCTLPKIQAYLKGLRENGELR